MEKSSQFRYAEGQSLGLAASDLSQPADRRHPLVPRDSKRWRRLNRGRAAVERTFGRLKNEYALAPLRVRGRERAALHADLTMLSQALAGLPLAWRVETARSHESMHVASLLDAVIARGFSPATVAMDMGYDNNRVYAECAERGCAAIIPLRRGQPERKLSSALSR